MGYPLMALGLCDSLEKFCITRGCWFLCRYIEMLHKYGDIPWIFQFGKEVQIIDERRILSGRPILTKSMEMVSQIKRRLTADYYYSMRIS